jgi:precorrin-2 dehydrogenase/sirohydrochlorin ferrochelatase
MNAFPAFIPLYGAKIVVVGDGAGAEAKARLVAGSPAEVVRIPEARALEPEAYEGARLAFVCVAEEETARNAAILARVAGALVNVVDRQHLGDFHTPAIVDRSPVICAIGTGGAAPVLATLLRNGIEARWPEGLGRVAALSGELQKTVREAIPDAARRRAWWRRLMRGPAAEAAMAGDVAEARRLAVEALGDPAAAGRVLFLNAPPRAGLMSLAAVQALAVADRIVAAADVAPEIVGFARREAERREAAGPEDLARWAGEGLTVVYLGGAETERLAQTVEGLGTAVERLPVAG